MLAVKYIVSSTHRLYIICGAIHFLPRTNIAGLPAGVLNGPIFRVGCAAVRTPIRSLGASAAEYAFLDDQRKLEISAVYLDTVDVHGMAAGTRTTTVDHVMAFLQWRALLLDHFHLEACVFAHSLQRAFCRALCMEKLPVGVGPEEWTGTCYRSSSAIVLSSCHVWLSTIGGRVCGSERLRNRARALPRTDLYRTMGRRLHVLQQGHVGMGSGFMAADDIVIVRSGVQRPFCFARKVVTASTVSLAMYLLTDSGIEK